jgi:hypothetical protein
MRDDTDLRENPRRTGTTNGWASIGSVLGDGVMQLGKNNSKSECVYCGAQYRCVAKGSVRWWVPRDDCCATRAAVQALNFSTHANDAKLPARERESHQEFLGRMMRRAREMEPAKRPTVSELYQRSFGTISLKEKGPVLCAKNFERLLTEHAWMPPRNDGTDFSDLEDAADD